MYILFMFQEFHVKLGGAKEKNYADAMRCVKEKVDLQKLGVNIKHIRRIRNGDTLLETKDGKETEEPEKLKTAIINAGEDSAKTLSKETRKTQILVKDLKEDASTESVVKVLQREIKAETESIRVRGFKEGHRGMQSALVYVSQVQAAKLLAEVGVRIKMDWVTCRL